MTLSVLKMFMVVLSRQACSQVVFYTLTALYFIFSSGELLHLVVGFYKLKLGHIVALMLLGFAMFERRTWEIERPMFYAFMLILGSLTLSATFGAAPLRCFGYVGVYLFNFVLYFLLPMQLIQFVDIERFLRIYWSSFVVVGLYATLQVGLSIFGIYEPYALQRIGLIARGQAWTYEPSYYALYMIPYVMFHNSMALFTDSSVYKLMGQNMLMIVSTSTGMIISYPVFFITSMIRSLNPFWYLVKQQLTKIIATFFVVVTVLSVLFYEIALNSIFKLFYSSIAMQVSFWSRWDVAVASFKVFLKYPLIGAGLGGVSPDRLKEESLYDFKPETLEEFAGLDPIISFTEVLASLGLVGLMAFIYLGIVFYRAFRRVQPADKRATALFISLIVTIVALQMNQGLFRPYIWIHAAVVYGYLLKMRAQDTSQLHHVNRLL